MSVKKMKSKKAAANMDGIMGDLNDIMLDLVGEGKAHLHLLIPKVAVLLHIQKKVTKLLEVLGSYTKSESIARDTREWSERSVVDLSKYPKLSEELGNFYNLLTHHAVTIDTVTAYAYSTIYDLPRDKLKNANLLIKLVVKCDKNTSADCEQCKASATPITTAHYIENEIGLETLYMNRQSEMTDEYLIAVSKEFSEFKKELFATDLSSAFVKAYEIKSVTKYIRELVVADDLVAFGDSKYSFMRKLPFGGYFMFAPILPQIDFKVLFDNARGDSVSSKMLLCLIDKFVTYATCVVKLVTGHSFDSKNFSNVITQALMSLRDSSGGRNNKIFNIIENSSHVFENNFTKYYNEYQATENPFIMFSSYIDELQRDVLNTNDSKKDTIEIIRQFRDLRKTLQSRINSAPIKSNKLKQFNKLSAIFDTLIKDEKVFDDDENKEGEDGGEGKYEDEVACNNDPTTTRGVSNETTAAETNTESRQLTREEKLAQCVEPALPDKRAAATSAADKISELTSVMSEYLSEMRADLPNQSADNDEEDSSEEELGDVSGSDDSDVDSISASEDGSNESDSNPDSDPVA